MKYITKIKERLKLKSAVRLTFQACLGIYSGLRLFKVRMSGDDRKKN